MEDAGTKTRRFGMAGLLLVLMANIMFALNVIAMKVVVDATAPLLSVALRMGVVFLLCAPAIRSLPRRTGWLALYGFLNGRPFLLLLNLALFMASNVGALAIAGQLSVPFPLLLGALLLGEKLNGQAWNGLMGVVTLARFALMFERPAIAGLVHAGWVPMAWFGFSSLGATIVGQGTLAWLLQRYPISTIMPLMLASPVISTVFASLYFTTPITAVMIGGGTVALIGVAIIALSPDRKSAPLVDGKG